MTKIKEKIYEHDFVYSHILDDIKIGQVWRSKNKERIGDKIVIIAVSNDKVFVSGVVDVVDPEFEKLYLIENYEQDLSF